MAFNREAALVIVVILRNLGLSFERAILLEKPVRRHTPPTNNKLGTESEGECFLPLEPVKREELLHGPPIDAG